MDQTIHDIIIIEPDDIFRNIVKRVLSNMDSNLLIQIYDYKDSETFLANHDIKESNSIYIIDEYLPVITGTELIREIRKTDTLSIIYIMSKSATTSEMINFLNAGSDNFFIKPFDLEVFKAVIQRKLIRGDAKWN